MAWFGCYIAWQVRSSKWNNSATAGGPTADAGTATAEVGIYLQNKLEFVHCRRENLEIPYLGFHESALANGYNIPTALQSYGSRRSVLRGVRNNCP